MLRRTAWCFLALTLLLTATAGQAVSNDIALVSTGEADAFAASHPHYKKVFSHHGKAVFISRHREALARLGVYSVGEKDAKHPYYIEYPSVIPRNAFTAGIPALVKRDNFAVVMMTEDEADKVGSFLHEDEGVVCGGMIRVIPEFELSASEEQLQNSARDWLQETPQKDDRIASVVGKISASDTAALMKAIEAIPTRYNRSPAGNDASTWVAKKMEEALKGKGTVRLFSHNRTPQKSVIATIKGTSNKLVIVGAHLDSIVMWPTDPSKRAPGADDDGSGVSTMLQAMQATVSSGLAFTHTIEFMGFAGEESGLLGSQEIAQAYKEEKREIVGMLQLDMNAYLAPKHDPKMYFVSNGTDKDLTAYAMDLAKLYVGLPTEAKRLSFGTSDHASFAMRGYPVVFPTENPDAFNFNLHKLSDTTENANAYALAAGYAKLSAAFAMTLAKIKE